MPLPPIPAEHHPELPWSVDALIAHQVLAKLQADPILAAVFNTMGAYEVEDFQRSETYSPPALGITPDGVEEVRKGSNRRAEITTFIKLTVLTRAQDYQGARTFLLSRLMDHVKAVLEQDGGQLWTPEGHPLTSGLLTWARLPGAEPLGSGLLSRIAVAGYKSYIHQELRR